ncbi:MAG: NTP transferase domain-containing protein, partial [Thermoleophilia bacterium]|nr:NTP transferase domain-containing protein [Thermoleophilia bacterium]
MSLVADTAVVILAAGRSSRMGTSKPLLPLGTGRVIERVVACASHAGIGDLVVVTGHEPDGVAAALAALPVRRAHNAGYDAGMFSSVQTGVRALREDVEAFFILPVDYPLVSTAVLRALLQSAAGNPKGILHPTCCGLRGHPPLLAGRYRKVIVDAGANENMHTLLELHHDDEAEVEIENPTILMDMDTMEDYHRIVRFAAFLDAASDAAPGAETDAAPAAQAEADARAEAPGATRAGPAAQAEPGALSSEDALFLLSLLRMPDPVVRHCRAVAIVGEALARALAPLVPTLDVELVRTACLLHDLARTQPKHAAVGRRVLCNLGLTRLGEIVGAHMVLPPAQLDTPHVTEEQLVYLADKLVID